MGCNALDIDYDKGTVTVGGKVLKEGDWISIDGFTGEVMAGPDRDQAQRNRAGADRQDAEARTSRRSISSSPS